MNILFLVFESEARSVGPLAMRFKKAGHRVLLASVDHFTVTHSPYEIFAYYRSIGLEDGEFTNLESVYRKINSYPEEMPSDVVDWDYLRYFENRYCTQRRLHEMTAMDTLMLNAFHHRRIYYHPANKNLFYKNLELHLRWLESIFTSTSFDFIYSLNFQYFLKAAAFAMAKALGIPFLMFTHCRISDRFLIYDNCQYGTPEIILEEMRRLAEVNDPCVEATKFIDEHKRSAAVPYKEFTSTAVLLKSRLNFTKRVRELVSYLKFAKSAVFVYRHYRGLLRPNYFLPSYLSYFRVMMLGFYRSITYFRYPVLNGRELPTGPYVYFPLHLIPESATLSLSPTLNELESMFQLLKTLPVDWKVVVKVNPHMLLGVDTHPNRYYLEMSRLSNVQFVSPLMPSNTIMEGASAVACLGGTALLEAAFYGKPGIRWGRTEFEAVDSISQFDSAQLPAILNKKGSTNVVYYVQACMNLATRIDILLLHTGVLKHPTPQRRMEFDQQVARMESAIEIYLKRNKFLCGQEKLYEQTRA